MNNDLRELSDNIITLSKRYHKARKEASSNKTAFKLLLAGRMREFYAIKKNIGHETATLMLLEEKDETTVKLYQDWNDAEADYYGLEKVISSLTDKLWLEKKLLDIV